MTTNEFRPWLRNYPHGMPANINPEAYVSVTDVLDETFKKYRNKPAFSCMGKEMTYGEVDEASRNFAAYLQSRGLERGDKIALMMPNILQYPIVLFGVLRAGLTTSPAPLRNAITASMPEAMAFR